MEKRYLSIDCTKIRKNSKRTKTRTIWDPLFLNHVHNQASFGKPVIKGRGFIYLGMSKMLLTF